MAYNSHLEQKTHQTNYASFTWHFFSARDLSEAPKIVHIVVKVENAQDGFWNEYSQTICFIPFPFENDETSYQ